MQIGRDGTSLLDAVLARVLRCGFNFESIANSVTSLTTLASFCLLYHLLNFLFRILFYSVSIAVVTLT